MHSGGEDTLARSLSEVRHLVVALERAERPRGTDPPKADPAAKTALTPEFEELFTGYVRGDPIPTDTFRAHVEAIVGCGAAPLDLLELHEQHLRETPVPEGMDPEHFYYRCRGFLLELSVHLADHLMRRVLGIGLL